MGLSCVHYHLASKKSLHPNQTKAKHQLCGKTFLEKKKKTEHSKILPITVLKE